MRKSRISFIAALVFFPALHAFAGTPAAITSPSNGSKLSSASVTFQWSGGVGISEYVLWIGSTANAHDIDNAVLGSTATSYTATNLPTNGETVYVTLNSLSGSTFLKNSYTYVASGHGTAAAISSPANNSTLSGTSATFHWSGGTGIDEYALWIGSTSGAHDIDNVVLGPTATSAFVTNLPTNGGRIYVTLNSLNGSTWLKNSYSYIASGTGTAAAITSPASGSKIANAITTFSWTAGSGIGEYLLYVGTTAGAHDLDNIVTTATSASVANAPTNGKTFYVELWSLNGATWLSHSYSYPTSTAPTLESVTESPSGAPLTIGGKVQFSAAGKYSDGSTHNITSAVVWNSSNHAVATIDAAGAATAAGTGNSTITATSGSLSASGAVLVTPACGTGTGALSLGTTDQPILALHQFGTEYTPDEHMSYLRQPDGSIRLWIAGGTTAGSGETIGFVTNDFVNLTPMTLSDGNAVGSLGPSGPGSENFDADYAGPGSVIPATSGTDLLMIYHAENHEFGGVHYADGSYYASIALARSTDNGVTWAREGQIITGMMPKPSGAPPRFALGAGNPTAIIANGYIYVFYVDWNMTYTDGIYVARAAVSSNGAPGAWEKYYNGTFSQPGLGGLSSIVQARPSVSDEFSGLPAVSYNTYLQKYLMVFNSGVGMHYSTSTDLVNWTLGNQIFTFPYNLATLTTGETWYDYQTLISPEQPNDRITSCAGFLYHTKGVWNTTPQTMYRFTAAFH